MSSSSSSNNNSSSSSVTLGNEEKRLETQTLRAAKKFRPTADPFPGTQDGQNLISWRWSLRSPTDPVW